MPVAVVVNTEQTFELKTLPGGYVKVRRMTYGETLKRSGMATKLYIDGASSGKDFKGELDVQQEKVTLWDFANLVVEHNLTDENDRPLNFKNAMDVNKLDGAIGQEIGQYIDDMNKFESNEEVKNL